MRMRVGTVVLLVAALVVGLVGADRALAINYEYMNLVNASNPTSWWRFEDPAGTTAYDSAGAANGTYVGTRTNVAGAVGQAAFFNPTDGGDYVNVPITPGVQLNTTDVSMSLWAKSATPTWNDLGWFGGERGANGVFIHPDGGGRYWRPFVVDDTGTYHQISGHTPAAIDDRFHQYAVTFDDASDTGKLYFDGQPVATVTGMSGFTRTAPTTIDLKIGKDDAAGRYGHGALDEVQVHDKALSSAAVVSQYAAVADGMYSALLQGHGATVHYRFDEGPAGSTPGTAVDSALAAGAQNATYVNNVVLGPAVVDNGATFDGTSQYVVGNAPVNDSFTVEVWAKSDTPDWNTWGWLGSARSPNGFILHPSPGVKSWQGYVVTSTGGFAQIGSYAPAAIDDKFHHYAITYDASTGVGRMFFDGDEVTGRNLGITHNATSAPIPVYIGLDGGAGARYGDGMADEFAISPSALSGGQIKRHFIAGEGTPYTRVIRRDGATVLLRFDDGPVGTSRPTAYDSAYADDILNPGGVGDDAAYQGSSILGPGLDGASLVLNGSNAYASGQMDIPASFTVEVWGKSATPTWNTTGWLAAARNTANGFIIHPSAGSTTWSAYVYDSTAPLGYNSIGAHDAVDIGQWHLYALSYDAANGIARMYFDGQMVAERTGMSLVRDATGPTWVYVGKDDFTGRYGYGMVDEFALYPYALSNEQALAHYHKLVPEPTTLTLAGLGALGLLARRRRRTK